MRSRIGIELAAVILLVGCGVPATETEVAGFANSLSEVEAPLAPVLKAGTERETSAEKARFLARGELVYDRPLDCIEIVFGPRTATEKLDRRSAACDAAPRFRAPLVRGSAAYAASGLSALRSYATVLEQISGSDVSAQVNANFQEFLTSINAFATANNAAGAENGVIKTDQIEPLGNIVGRAVEARRGAILKRLVNAAHPQIKVIIAELIAYREPSERLLSQARALNTAYENLTTAQDSGNPEYYARMTARYEAELASFQKSVGASDAGRLMALWRAHQILHAQINGPGDPVELIGLLEDFKALAKTN
ncbi:hypothetical protein A8B82_18010 [Sulfitobacter sp. EhC04]|uniref:hypothetical protein n=1 Tax=Sulfitobacter sp. EhC04 TaxID=1849168 RepID=UPI0007F4B2B0|nr:hypothetical protein [Sulfitobacter sp. EhC04]OAN74651.1 hypothetical protein A8B82_18010 [Sulfitobacter sp. EhC04]